MSESFFFIQNHRFLLPDLEHMDSQEIHISSVPRPYNAIFHTSGHSTFSWIEPLLASAAHPLLFIDRRLRNSVLGSLSFSGIPCCEKSPWPVLRSPSGSYRSCLHQNTPPR